MPQQLENLGQLRTLLNALIQEELKQPIRFWGEDTSGTITSLEILSENYINPSGEGCEPVSAYKDEEDYEDLYATEPVVFPKGTIVFEVWRGDPATNKYFEKCPTCQAPCREEWVDSPSDEYKMTKKFVYAGK
jgi:hypothetical protein